MHQTQQKRFIPLLLVAVSAMVTVLFLPVIPQDPAYHRFADSRTLFGISNFINVMTNLAYILVGGLGLLSVRAGIVKKVDETESDIANRLYRLFYAGIVLTGLGSGWYHLAPDNDSLFWDRLPMAIAFMSLFSILLYERVSRQWARRLYVPLILLGMLSVLYWIYTEHQGRGDLRPYIAVQFLPVLLMPLVLLLYKTPGHRDEYLWLLFGGYVLAKTAEHMDTGIFHFTASIVSGHSLKHVLSAVAVIFLVKHYQQSLDRKS